MMHSQNLERHFAGTSGLTLFPVGNAWHGVSVGTVRDSRPGEVSDETVEALLAEVARLMPLESVAALTLFVPEAGVTQRWLEQVAAAFPEEATPALTCVAQPVCEPDRIGFEAYGFPHKDVTFDRDRAKNLVQICHDGLTWVHGGQVTSLGPSAVYDGSSAMFHQAQERLVATGSHFNQVVRTWLYLGDIVGRDGQTVRYHELNRARSDFFEHDAHAVAPYPASTGIGQAGTDITMNFLSLTADRDGMFRNVALENPLQTSAFDYEAKYGRKSPKFSRAMATVFDRQTILWVSGTASITDSETRHQGDVAAQTNQTLENIRALISSENLARHGLEKKGSEKKGSDTFCRNGPKGASHKRCLTPFSLPFSLVSVRVYVKNRADYPVVRSLCEARLGQIPTIYVIADVCRNDLLVEIEAIGYCWEMM
ncbi:MAG: dioxygenase [Planctomycetia bacterium]|jgi:enamine deaminase RidA (YjgF/YER057c/UK114 family)